MMDEEKLLLQRLNEAKIEYYKCAIPRLEKELEIFLRGRVLNPYHWYNRLKQEKLEDKTTKKNWKRLYLYFHPDKRNLQSEEEANKCFNFLQQLVEKDDIEKLEYLNDQPQERWYETLYKMMNSTYVDELELKFNKLTNPLIKEIYILESELQTETELIKEKEKLEKENKILREEKDNIISKIKELREDILREKKL